MLKPRNRLVNFRVTEEEYEGLKAASTAHGARCLSDFARVIILRFAGMPQAADREGPAGSMAAQLVNLDRRIAALETEMGRLLNLPKEGGMGSREA